MGDVPHLDRVSIETGQDLVQPGEITAIDQVTPPLQVALGGLTGHAVPEAVEIALDPRPPLLEALAVVERGDSAMEPPGSSFGAGEVGNNWSADDLEPAPMHDRSRSSCASLNWTRPERKPLMLGRRTPLGSDRSDCEVPVSSITSRSTSFRDVMGGPRASESIAGQRAFGRQRLAWGPRAVAPYHREVSGSWKVVRRGVRWVEQERASLAVDLGVADPDAPTLCRGWTVRHLCAHLVQRQDAIMRNIWDQVATRTPGEERFMGRLVDQAQTPEGYAALVETFASGPSRHSLVGRFDEAFNLVEYVVHHEDLRRGAGPVPPRDLPAAEVEEIWRRAQPIVKRAYRKAPVGVLLAPDDGAVLSLGGGPAAITVAGPRLELLLHAFGRREAAEVEVDGPVDSVSSFTRWAQS